MIKINNLTKYVLGEPLFEELSFVLNPGDKVGIVGPNGCGKSTLFKIIIGEVEADSGDVQIGNERIGYLSQELPFEEGETVGSFLSASQEPKVKEVLEKVGLGGIRHDMSVSKLSGGQKTKLSLARILLIRPSVLLLDEPTNHLDTKGLDWLEAFIRNFRGGVFVVSHDRRLLDNSVTKILEIDAVTHAGIEYEGGYSEYVVEKERREEKQESDYERQQELIRKTEHWLALKREQATAHPNPAVGRLIKAREKWLQREVYDKVIARPKNLKRLSSLELSGETAHAKLIVRAEKVSKSFPERMVLRDVSFEMRGREHVLLAGENGSGKTTILKMIIGEQHADEGTIKIGENVHVGYFAQEHEVLDLQKTVIDEFLSTEGVRCDEYTARKILGSFRFRGQEVFRLVSKLSLGERVRLMFAKLTNQRNEFLVLDEPTNHVDIATRETIEDALLDYKGAILVVSHDRYFLDKIGIDRALTIRNGVLSNNSVA